MRFLVTTKSQGGALASKRELIEPREGDKRFVRRDASGKFSEVDDASRSLKQDRQRSARKTSRPGMGDKGDRNAGSRSRRK